MTPRLTREWLKDRSACTPGFERFAEHAPRGGLVMDEAAAWVEYHR